MTLPTQQRTPTGAGSPTVVLVHGSWADASSWNGVLNKLHHAGFAVLAPPNHLRSLAADAASVRAFVDAIPGPVVLVGHSYGGAVITNAATGAANVEALVYVNAFMPDEGENVTALAGPDSSLSADPTTVFDLVPPVFPPTPDTEVYLKPDTVRNSFAIGLHNPVKAQIAATQRPATLAALNEPSGPPAWRSVRSWAFIGTEDLIIPPDVQRSMASRAGATVTEVHAGHLGLMTEPRAVAKVIEHATSAVVAR
ncbi:alpha/beta hydrolase [Nocardioides sp. YIM 152315]|uniref:alpha/beta fold hydrolase n=1 Tax=Nocardioides sp. YIM 152315 TaxID=3031760 RepID=UPI0023DBF7BB|nr:alpha/beta hydrolase [Nocardioides sp. YIM 152315]MDF1602048.1 alpha/beta hydrolase [Nocardioides sp. YIM 152315]